MSIGPSAMKEIASFSMASSFHTQHLQIYGEVRGAEKPPGPLQQMHHARPGRLITRRMARVRKLLLLNPKMARPKRFELLTPRFVVWCSIQLSYGRLRTVALRRDGKR